MSAPARTPQPFPGVGDSVSGGDARACRDRFPQRGPTLQFTRLAATPRGWLPLLPLLPLQGPPDPSDDETTPPLQRGGRRQQHVRVYLPRITNVGMNAPALYAQQPVDARLAARGRPTL